LSPPNPDHDFKSIKKEAPPLSGRALEELLQAVFQKNMPFRFKAGGTSMSPFIKDGDILTISPLGEDPPRIGDVVIFMHPVSRKPVVHRVVAKKGDVYRIKGDNLQARGHWLSRKSILARLERLQRNGKDISLGFGSVRRLVAFLSRSNLFAGLLSPLWRALQSRK